MKKSIVISFLFLFMVAIASPVMANDSIQEPEKTEKAEKTEKTVKKCDKDCKKDCCTKKKSECKTKCCKKKDK